MLLARLCALARAAVPKQAAAVGADAGAAVPLYRHHRRLDDRRTGPPAVADLWSDAHRRRQFRRVCRPATVFSRSSDSWALYLVLGILFLFLVHPRNRTGPDRDGRALTASWRRRLRNDRHGLVLPGRDHDRRIRSPGWIRSRRRHRAPVCRAHRSRTPAGAALHRSGVGRQRSLAAGRRRHPVLRLSRSLFGGFQRLLSAR